MKKTEDHLHGHNLDDLLQQHREKLMRMVRCRMDRRLQGRIDPSDVVQEACVEAAMRYAEYQKNNKMPFYHWLRFLTVQQLMILHRQHLGTKMRSVNREVSLEDVQGPDVNVVMLADVLSGSLTSPSSAVARKEVQARLIAALDALDPNDREILTLRHFEQLNTVESAQILGISEGLASTRYGRAVRKLLAVLKELFGTECEFRQ
ncbi:MAG TPA: sigma-70 family RNA polymerase sigma factor [Gemmatales bacterium]|nr:sigma-70 family RNA polymerase sigma factor [Gemmatales bacterium]